MLSSFSIKNFRSIVDLTVDFTYGEGKAPNGYQQSEFLPFIETDAKERFVPCMAFLGANASGKTNIIKAMAAFKKLTTEGMPLAVFFEPNELNRKYQDTTFSLKFNLGENVFEYSITYGAKQIIGEVLKKNGESLFEIRQLKPDFSEQLLTQGYPKEKLEDILRVECSDGNGNQTKFFFNRLGLGYQGLNKDVKESFEYFKNKLLTFFNNDTVLLPAAVQFLAPLFDNNREAALQEIVDIVRRLDIDIDKIDIIRTALPDDASAPLMKINLLAPANYGVMETDSTGKRSSLMIMASHKDTSGQVRLLDFLKAESAGTQRLAGLVGILLYALKTGTTIFVDEIECSLHPLLVRELVLLFKKRFYNEKGAQLIFTTHGTDILDDSILRVSEIALVRKNLGNGTMIRRLVDLKGEGVAVRNVTNFRKQYLEGFYSGIPHPAI